MRVECSAAVQFRRLGIDLPGLGHRHPR
jgi:hypothetical protein